MDSGAITESLNTAYDLKETRPWWKQRLTAIGLTMALSVLIIGALVLVVAGGKIAEWLAATYGFGPVFPLDVEDHSVAGGACVHDFRVCVDLLLRT